MSSGFLAWSRGSLTETGNSEGEGDSAGDVRGSDDLGSGHV